MNVEKVKQAILILDGELHLDFVTEQAKNHQVDLVACADGAYLHLKHLPEMLTKLDVVIGDFDSIGDKASIDPNIEQAYDSDQDTTDFEKALAYLKKKQIEKVIIYGASGLSSDHFLGNLSTALAWKNVLTLEFHDRYGVFYFIDKEIELTGVKGHKISVIPVFEANDIYYEGLMYPLNGEPLIFGKRIGTRNIAISDTVKIRYGSGNLLVYIENRDYVKERGVK